MNEATDLQWFKDTSRGALYGSLSSLYQNAVDLNKIDTLLQLCKQHEADDSSLLKEFLADNETLQTLKERYVEAKDDPDQEELHYKVEYTHLFLLPEGVHPYESVYLGKKKLLMDKPWEEVRNFYRKVGVEKDKEELHPEDHLSTELGFMSLMAYMIIGSIEEGSDFTGLLEMQMEFIEKHLSRWLPQLADNVLNNNYADIYKPLVVLTDELLAWDLAQIHKTLLPAETEPVKGDQ